jgi:hypothetical protein
VVSSICALICETRPSISAFLPAPSTIVVFSFVDHDLLGFAEHVEVTFSSLMPRSSEITCAAGQDRDVFQHGLAAVAEARGLHGSDLEAAAQLVHDEGREGFAFDVFRDDEQRTARLHDGFEHRQHRLQRGELLLVEQDVGRRRARPSILSALVTKYGER